MALKVQNTGEATRYAMVIAFNAFVREFVDTETTYPHYEATSITTGDFSHPATSPFLVTATSTSDLAAVKTMANEARKVLLAHFLDANAHVLADATNAALIDLTALDDLVTADTQGTVDTFINALSTAYEAHRVESGVHSHDDTTNLYTAPASSDLATSKVAVADVKTQANAHIQLAWPTPSIELV